MNTYSQYKEMLDRIRASGVDVIDEYLSYAKKTYGGSHPVVVCPKLLQAVTAHRYLLPNRLQSDYIKQEICDYLFLDFMVSYSLGLLEFDDITHICYIIGLEALKYERPTYYIERSLAEALLRTDVPQDVQSGDIHWIYPQLRIYLPNNLIGITRNENFNPVMYLDICHGKAEAEHQMPFVWAEELYKIGGKYFPKHVIPHEAFLMNAHLHIDCAESSINYGYTVPWHATKIREMIDVGNTSMLQSEMVSDDLDKQFTSRVFCFAVNVMLYLSSLPEEAHRTLVQQQTVIRKPKQEGKRHIPGLYAAKVIGIDDIKRQPDIEKLKTEPTGRHVIAHWRRGHWRRQAYGPKMGLRRFQWIAPYKTHETETKRS